MPDIEDTTPEWNEDIEQQQVDDELRVHEALYPRGKRLSTEEQDELYLIDYHQSIERGEMT